MWLGINSLSMGKTLAKKNYLYKGTFASHSYEISHSDLPLICLANSSYFFKLLIVYTIIMHSYPVVLYSSSSGQ